MALGQHDVDAMLGGLTQEQLFRWMAYERLDPFGEARADLRSATVAAVIANANRGKRRPFKVADFMPTFDKPKQDWRDMKATFKRFAAVHNHMIEARRRV